MKFQTQYDLFEPIQVHKSELSETVPDMSFTPREIIAKFSRGERVPLGMEGLYDADDASPFEEDPTRDPAFDFGDYVEEKFALEERQAKQRRSKEKQLLDSQRKARSEEVSVSDPMRSETTSGEANNAPR